MRLGVLFSRAWFACLQGAVPRTSWRRDETVTRQSSQGWLLFAKCRGTQRMHSKQGKPKACSQFVGPSCWLPLLSADLNPQKLDLLRHTLMLQILQLARITGPKMRKAGGGQCRQADHNPHPNDGPGNVQGLGAQSHSLPRRWRRQRDGLGNVGPSASGFQGPKARSSGVGTTFLGRIWRLRSFGRECFVWNVLKST